MDALEAHDLEAKLALVLRDVGQATPST